MISSYSVPGSYLIKQDCPGHYFFVIASGSVVVTVENETSDDSSYGSNTDDLCIDIDGIIKNGDVGEDLDAHGIADIELGPNGLVKLPYGHRQVAELGPWE